MIVKELMDLLANVDPKANVNLMITNDDGLVGNRVIDDQNVFGFWDKDNAEGHGIFVISNREIDDGAS